jgi:hypothetical protein
VGENKISQGFIDNQWFVWVKSPSVACSSALTFSLVAKEKVTKRKAIFGQLLRWPKRGSTLDAHRYGQLYGAGFSCLSPTTIQRWLLLDSCFKCCIPATFYGEKRHH